MTNPQKIPKSGKVNHLKQLLRLPSVDLFTDTVFSSNINLSRPKVIIFCESGVIDNVVHSPSTTTTGVTGNRV